MRHILELRRLSFKVEHNKRQNGKIEDYVGNHRGRISSSVDVDLDKTKR